MKAFILAAGLGTRLRPWTLHHPKALVPVKGVPMLQRVIENLKGQGFDEIVVNVHHFADQIVDFLEKNDFGVKIEISDERSQLLDTGGAILHARHLLCRDDRPFLIHNVDILSDADLHQLMKTHIANGKEGILSTLLVSDRESSRKLIFDKECRLSGWHNLNTDAYKPEGFMHNKEECRELAFSGIHVMSPALVEMMIELRVNKVFSIVDFLLEVSSRKVVKASYAYDLHLLDIGKPESLEQAQRFLL
ncbi:MAG: nucleotidyltransferase family protein [Muribaculum sp.]|nr:nucleotidyltransferase family protein [Muribaculum sp.]